MPKLKPDERFAQAHDSAHFVTSTYVISDGFRLIACLSLDQHCALIRLKTFGEIWNCLVDSCAIESATT